MFGGCENPEHMSGKLLKCISLVSDNFIITEVRDFISETMEVHAGLALLEQNIVEFTGGLHHILVY